MLEHENAFGDELVELDESLLEQTDLRLETESSDKVNRWHAVTNHGLVSAPTKLLLKKKLLATRPGTQVQHVLRGKSVATQQTVAF